jgi:hypothetical protein
MIGFAFIVTAFAALSSAGASTTRDVAALNFALNLECLEAEFYSWAAFGKGLNADQRGNGPASVGGRNASLGDYLGIASEIAGEEIKHVELLRGALGKMAVPCPAMDIGSAFAAAADAAFNTTLDPAFDPYAGKLKFLHGALLFEDVGVMAYNGAIDVIEDTKLAKVARSIMAVEAYHAGIVRTGLMGYNRTTVVQPYNLTVGNATELIGRTLASLLRLRDANLTISSGLTPTDGNAMALSATARQVMNVLFLDRNSTMGGFFPEGLNVYVPPNCTFPAAPRYAKCAGAGMKERCCEPYNYCTFVNDYWSGCQPGGLPADMVQWYGVCNGTGYAGPTKCEPKSVCVYKDENYSICEPTRA